MMNSVRLLVLLFLFNSMYNCEKDACSLKLCKCNKGIVRCIDTNLTYIPVLPNRTYELFFGGNYLPLINEHTFSNISHLPRLKMLKLDRCFITNITTNTFKFLKHIRSLWLSYNPLTTDSLLNLFSDLKNSFYNSLSLHQIGLKFLPEGLFKNTFIDNLDISQNFLKTLNFTEFNSLGLKVLKVENNLIETIVMDKMVNLKELYLVSNNIRSLPDFCHGKSYFPSLTYFNILNNSICKYIPRNMNCLKKLSQFILIQNCISRIESGSFQELSSLTKLNLSQQKNSRSSFRMDRYSFNNSNLAKLSLHDNGFKMKNIDPSVFSGCHGMEQLDISGNHLNGPPGQTYTKLDQVLSELNSLQHLDIGNGKLNNIPKSIQNFTKLQYLSLFENGISNWKDGFWVGMVNLTYLDLGRNIIRKMTNEMLPMKLRSQIKCISLQYNPIGCICDNVWLIKWINRDHTKFQNFPDGYNCLNMTERICLINSPVYISITGVICVLLIVFLVVSIVYKHRWFIKYKYYIWRHQPKLLNIMAERQYLYDVFVSYSAEDSSWIVDDLVPQLEGNEGLKLCIKDRDFPVGGSIIDNIVESVENSRRVLIILSNNFARSEWCQFEMTLAQKHVLNPVIEPLSVVLLEDIDCENMSNSLHALLKTTTYITWNDEEEYIQLFWDRLKNSLI